MWTYGSKLIILLALAGAWVGALAIVYEDYNADYEHRPDWSRTISQPYEGAGAAPNHQVYYNSFSYTPAKDYFSSYLNNWTPHTQRSGDSSYQQRYYAPPENKRPLMKSYAPMNNRHITFYHSPLPQYTAIKSSASSVITTRGRSTALRLFDLPYSPYQMPESYAPLKGPAEREQTSHLHHRTEVLKSAIAKAIGTKGMSSSASAYSDSISSGRTSSISGLTSSGRNGADLGSLLRYASNVNPKNLPVTETTTTTTTSEKARTKTTSGLRPVAATRQIDLTETTTTSEKARTKTTSALRPVAAARQINLNPSTEEPITTTENAKTTSESSTTESSSGSGSGPVAAARQINLNPSTEEPITTTENAKTTSESSTTESSSGSGSGPVAAARQINLNPSTEEPITTTESATSTIESSTTETSSGSGSGPVAAARQINLNPSTVTEMPITTTENATTTNGSSSTETSSDAAPGLSAKAQEIGLNSRNVAETPTSVPDPSIITTEAPTTIIENSITEKSSDTVANAKEANLSSSNDAKPSQSTTKIATTTTNAKRRSSVSEISTDATDPTTSNIPSSSAETTTVVATMAKIPSNNNGGLTETQNRRSGPEKDNNNRATMDNAAGLTNSINKRPTEDSRTRSATPNAEKPADSRSGKSNSVIFLQLHLPNGQVWNFTLASIDYIPGYYPSEPTIAIFEKSRELFKTTICHSPHTSVLRTRGTSKYDYSMSSYASEDSHYESF